MEKTYHAKYFKRVIGHAALARQLHLLDLEDTAIDIPNEWIQGTVKPSAFSCSPDTTCFVSRTMNIPVFWTEPAHNEFLFYTLNVE